MSTPVVVLTLGGLSVINLLVLLAVAHRLVTLSGDPTGRPPGGSPGGGAGRRPAAGGESANGSAGDGAGDDAGLGLPAVGQKVGQFRAVTADGLPLGTADLTGRTLVGFFAEGCGVCSDLVPRFARQATVFPGGRDQVLAVVTARPDAPSPLAGQLAGSARVVVDPGRVAAAFHVDGFPAVCLLHDAVVIAAEAKLEALRLPQPSTTAAP